jgi:hypothetical protein
MIRVCLGGAASTTCPSAGPLAMPQARGRAGAPFWLVMSGTDYWPLTRVGVIVIVTVIVMVTVIALVIPT